MATLVLGTLLKVSAVVVTAGASIATPILLKKNGVFSTSSSSEEKRTMTKSAENAGGEVTPSAVGDSQSQYNSELQTQRASESESSSSASHSDESSLSTPATTQTSLNKTCFVVPTTSENSYELLACLGEASEDGKSEMYAEYESLYYLAGPEKEYLFLEEKDKLMWSPKKRQISVNLEEKDTTRKSMNDSVFKAEGDEWNDVLNGEYDLKRECSIFKNDSLNALNSRSYLWVCGNHLNDFSDNNPKGIPLTPWPKIK